MVGILTSLCSKTKPLNTGLLILKKIVVIIVLLILITREKMRTKFIGKAKLSRQGQLTLPFEARQDMDIELDSEVYWYEIDNCLIVTKELVSQKDLMNVVLNKRGKK